MPCVLPNIARLFLLAIIHRTLAAGPAPVLLGTAGNFAILAKSGVSTVPNSLVDGDVGVSPIATTALTGFSLMQDPNLKFWTSTQVNGLLMGASDAPPTPALLTTAVLDMQTAYTDAMNRPFPDFVNLNAGIIGGLVLVPGIYQWTTGVSIPLDITIVGGSDDTWIFQITGTLVQAAGVHITLIGGALSQNIIWVVAGAVTVGTNAVFEGNILAQTNVVIETNAVDNGCIYAQTAVTLQKATVLCAGETVCTPTTYTVEFQNLNASIIGDDYLGYILTDTDQECIDFCFTIPSVCAFVNPYHDNGEKNTTMLTCAYYSGCHTAADATNFGGQTDPDGSIGTISNSSGASEPHWYKRNQNTIQAIYNLTIFPANAKIIAEDSSAVPAGLFNINATGRVTPVGEFFGFQDSIEYFFGLAPLLSGVLPNGAITNATLVEFTSGCPEVVTSTVYLTVSTINPENSTGAYITALKQVRIIPFARLAALHLFYGTDILLAFRLRGGCAQIRWIPSLDLFTTALTDGTFYTPAGMNGIIEGICGL
ncbi:hypothetical protein B0H11DRAFT_2277873 [Mycena galericulata]|nr:hypothetical protein B0H11DRAFT_2277873 [Mycena galericulata]